MSQPKPPSGGGLRSNHARSGARHERGRVAMQDRLARLGVLCPGNIDFGDSVQITSQPHLFADYFREAAQLLRGYCTD